MGLKEKFASEITATIEKIKNANEQVGWNDFVLDLKEIIIGNYNYKKSEDQYKAEWKNAFKSSITKAMVARSPTDDWEVLISPSLKKSDGSSSSRTKVVMSESDKNDLLREFAKFKKSDFMYLSSNKNESVEEKLFNLSLKCKYKHPAQYFIIDTNDQNMEDIFSAEELDELDAFGGPLNLPSDEKLEKTLKQFSELGSPLEAYNFARTLEHDPIEDPLLSWFSTTIMTTARLFLYKKNKTGKFEESDKQCRQWGFVNTIFDSSEIDCLGKEKTSRANALAKNKKRKISGIDVITRSKMGYRVDTVYKIGDFEIGVMEAGGRKHDPTKELEEGTFKLPIIMNHMMNEIKNVFPGLKIEVIGFNIHDSSIQLLIIDQLTKNLTRVRRLEKVPFPSNADDFVSRMGPLMSLAVAAYLKMEASARKINSTPASLRLARR